jgi:O-antigen/teichoic acid export membrane protein
LVVLAAAVAAGLALSLLASPPLLWLLAAVVIAVACLGSDQLIHAHWRRHRRLRRRYDITLWIFPALIVAGGFLVLRLPFFGSPAAIVAGIALTTVLFAVVVVCQLHSLSSEDPRLPQRLRHLQRDLRSPCQKPLLGHGRDGRDVPDLLGAVPRP